MARPSLPAKQSGYQACSIPPLRLCQGAYDSSYDLLYVYAIPLPEVGPMFQYNHESHWGSAHQATRSSRPLSWLPDVMVIHVSLAVLRLLCIMSNGRSALHGNVLQHARPATESRIGFPTLPSNHFKYPTGKLRGPRERGSLVAHPAQVWRLGPLCTSREYGDLEGRNSLWRNRCG